MSVTDGTSSRLLACPVASTDRCAPTSPTGAFDRLKGLATILLRASAVVVLLDDERGDAEESSSAIQAFARLVRKRGPTFVADAMSQSWPTDALVLGGLGPVACGGVPLTLTDGSIAGCVCVVAAEAREWARDDEEILLGIAAEIAARVELRRAQRDERLRAAEAIGRVELLDTILANSADHLFVFDRDARYTYASRAGAKAVGKTPSEMMGKTLAEMGFPADVSEPIERQIRSVFLTGGSVSGEARVDLPEGRRDFEHVFSPVFGPTGRVDAVVATVRDITGRKAIEHDLKQAKTAAERAAVVKDQFLAALSHELRTPLTPVLAAVSALSADGTLPEHVRGAVGMIRRNVELQTRLIDDLLDLTRVARGKITLKLDVVDLTVALREAVEMCRDDAVAKGVRLELPSGDLSTYVRADGARVRQVLWNLIKNAVKFTPTDGEVTITIQPADAGRVSLAVRDTGIGIPAHLIERIFLPFEQGDPAMARRFGGLGLGLAISKALVELHGGELTACSAGIGRGATFTMTLPAAPAPHPHEDGECGESAPLAVARRLRVLLVDDHEDTRYVLRRLLGDHDVRTAGCVSEALEEAALYDFDLLISDIGLPDGSGLDLMKQLRARYGMQGIALSGYGMEDDVQRSLGAGFHAHLTKPVTADELYTAIAQVSRELGDVAPDAE
jgi:two-component system CheB/CheR fusion protein